MRDKGSFIYYAAQTMLISPLPLRNAIVYGEFMDCNIKLDILFHYVHYVVCEWFQRIFIHADLMESACYLNLNL